MAVPRSEAPCHGNGGNSRIDATFTGISSVYLTELPHKTRSNPPFNMRVLKGYDTKLSEQEHTGGDLE